MSRQVYLMGVGLALVALAFVVTDALLWGPGVTEANVRRVRVGMTIREVESILGGPGSTGQVRGTTPTIHVSTSVDGVTHWYYHWVGPGGIAAVTFAAPDPQGERCQGFFLSPLARVEAASFVRTASSSLLQRLRDWLGW
jgi:hypothetical protein